MVTPAGVPEPPAGIQTVVAGAMPTTSVRIPAHGFVTPTGVASKFDV